MMGKRKIVNSVLLHVVLAVLAVIWITPIVWLIVTSFSGYDGMNTSRFFPETWSIRNYTRMLFEPDTVSQFPIWFKNTLVIAIFVCLISTSFVLMVSYAMSCMRFKGRKALMNIAVMLQLFPGFLSMIAIYFILKSVNLTNSHIGMILVYSGASGLGYLWRRDSLIRFRHPCVRLRIWRVLPRQEHSSRSCFRFPSRSLCTLLSVLSWYRGQISFLQRSS